MGKHMSEPANHLSEEELIDHYYGESKPQVERHLKACSRCAQQYSALERELGSIQGPAVPARGEEYGKEVWQSIRASLPAYQAPKRGWAAIGFRRPFVLATACALLVVAAFVAGRVWQKKEAPNVAVSSDTNPRQRVVVWVLGDHLDKTERLLVELNHATGKDPAEAQPIQVEARELLSANRLLRQSASQSRDPELDAALDRLERLLVEVANEPGGLSEADLARLRQEMNTDGLLFDVRVLRSRVTEQQPSTAAQGKGVAI
jgi:hypothetical protein